MFDVLCPCRIGLTTDTRNGLIEFSVSDGQPANSVCIVLPPVTARALALMLLRGAENLESQAEEQGGSSPPPPERPKCQNCGGPVDPSPRTEKMETASLCWVCARLYHSVQSETRSGVDR